MRGLFAWPLPQDRLLASPQVLSNEELRAKYDAAGKEGLGDHDFVDTGAFFAALFGALEAYFASPAAETGFSHHRPPSPSPLLCPCLSSAPLARTPKPGQLVPQLIRPLSATTKTLSRLSFVVPSGCS